jgi:hypothetical protein
MRARASKMLVVVQPPPASSATSRPAPGPPPSPVDARPRKAQAVRESTAAWPAGARVAQAIIRGRRMQPGHWPLSRPRLRARTGASAELGAGPEIDDSKTTNSCFTSPPTPKALPLPPQNPRFVCPKALTSTLPSLLDVATALAPEAGPQYVLSSLNTPQTLADPFRSLYASHYIIRTWQDLWARLIRLVLSLTCCDSDSRYCKSPEIGRRVAAQHVLQSSRRYAATAVAFSRPRNLLIRPGRSAKPAA